MLDLTFWVNFLASLFLFLLLGAILESKEFIPPRQFVSEHPRNTMSLTRWIKHDPARKLLKHCASHAMDESTLETPEMDEWYYAHRTCTSLLCGKIGQRHIIVKVWRGAHMGENVQKQFVKQLSRELDNWKRASHPNIAPFLGVMSGFGHLPSLVMPFYNNGNINDYLAKKPETNILYLLNGVAEALAYMHNLTPPLAHGGVRGPNILISDKGEPQLTDVSICSMPHSPDLTYVGSEFLGTRWMAPEVIDPQPEMSLNNDAGFETPQSDVYSFGMTVLEVFSGRHPFAHRRLHTGVIFDVVQGLRPPRPVCAKLTDPVWKLIESCWHQDPRERPTMNAVRAWIRLLSLVQVDSHIDPTPQSDDRQPIMES